MEVAGIALAIPSLLDLCLRHGQNMHKRYQSFHNAESELQKRILVLESRWLQIQAQIKFLKAVWHGLPARLQVHFNHVLSMLQTLLIRGGNMVDALIISKDPSPRGNVVSLLTAISKEGKLRRGAFALTQKDALDNLIDELRAWHNDMLGPSWFQLLRLPSELIFATDESDNASPQISQLQQLRKQITQADQNAIHKRTHLPNSESTLVSQRPLFASPLSTCMVDEPHRQVIVDIISVPSCADPNETYEAFQTLADKMERPEMSAINLLQCRGIQPISHPGANSSLAMLYEIPTGLSNPRSLRELFLECNVGFPIRHRISIAQQLAKSVMSIHSLSLVHKNIRPETIVVLSHETDSRLESFILGFEQFRLVNQETFYRGDSDWRKNLYRHPSRQGIHPETEYIMQHDIYSLGVCLLELGLKRSFVINPGTEGRAHPDIEITKYPAKDQERSSLLLKNQLQKIARTELAAVMGQRYSDAVISCLSCLDRGNSTFGEKEDFSDTHDILVSVRFMEAVSLGEV